jgi:hypothetical protein
MHARTSTYVYESPLRSLAIPTLLSQQSQQPRHPRIQRDIYFVLSENLLFFPISATLTNLSLPVIGLLIYPGTRHLLDPRQPLS